MGRFRHRTNQHTCKRSQPALPAAPPATDPSSARLDPPRPPAAQHIHLDYLQRQLHDAEDLCSDLAAGAAIAMHRQIHCPSDGGEGGPVVLRAASQQRASCPSDSLTPVKIFLASGQLFVRTSQKKMFLSDTRSSADLHPKRIPCSELQRESAAQLARGPERGPNSLEKQ